MSTATRPTRRTGLAWQAPGGGLPRHRGDTRRGPGGRGRRHPPRLRLPFRERRLCRGLRAPRRPLPRPRPAIVRLMGDKVAAKQLAERVGVAVVPGTTLEGTEPRCLPPRGASSRATGRLSEGRARGRRPRHARGAHAGGTRAVARLRPFRVHNSPSGARWSSSRPFSSGCATSKSRFWATSTGTSSTCTSATARCSAATRKSSRLRRRPTSPSPSGEKLFDAALKLMRAAEYSSAGTVEFLVAGDECLLHRGQRPAPGGAHRHRAGDGRRPGPGPAAHRRGPRSRSEQIGIESQSPSSPVASRCSCASPPRTRPTTSSPTRAPSRPGGRPPASASGSTAATGTRAPSSPPPTTRCW